MTADGAFPLGQLSTLVFMMMGPVSLIPLFSAMTRAADAPLRHAIALRAFGFAVIALVIAIAIGAGLLTQWGVSRPALIIAAGLLLTLASLRNVLGGQSAAPPAEPAKPPSRELALSPLAFPSIVTPYGIGVLIVFVAYAPDADVKLSIFGISLAIMVIDLFAMIFAHRLMKWLGAGSLKILGAVFGVLQIALGIEMVISGVMMRVSGAT